MGIEFFDCDICGEGMNDCMPTFYCNKCKSELCENCHEKQKDKYGITLGEELKECNNCSKST